MKLNVQLPSDGPSRNSTRANPLRAAPYITTFSPATLFLLIPAAAALFSGCKLRAELSDKKKLYDQLTQQKAESIVPAHRTVQAPENRE
jgi:hypothetical protein